MSDFTINREMRWLDAVGRIVLFPILLLMVAFDKYWEWDEQRRRRMTTKHNLAPELKKIQTEPCSGDAPVYPSEREKWLEAQGGTEIPICDRCHQPKTFLNAIGYRCLNVGCQVEQTAQPEASPEPQAREWRKQQNKGEYIHDVSQVMYTEDECDELLVAYAAAQNAALKAEVERLTRLLNHEAVVSDKRKEERDAAESRLRAREEEIARLERKIADLERSEWLK